MDIERIGVALLVLLPLLLVWDGLMGAVVWKLGGWHVPTLVVSGHGGRRERLAGAAVVATWLGLSTVTMWCEFLVAFMVVHLLLFVFGSAVALVGLVLSAAILLVTPIGWARLIRDHVQRV